MRFTTNPMLGLVLALLLLFAGWLVVTQGQGGVRVVGGLLMAVGALTAAVNAAVLGRRKRD